MMDKAHVHVDYPQEGEVIDDFCYTFRIDAPENAQDVEVSINRGPWLACRKDAGYWWFDWECDDAGEYELAAMAKAPDGHYETVGQRRFSVV
jgi:hypothetical protein